MFGYVSLIKLFKVYLRDLYLFLKFAFISLFYKTCKATN